MAMIFEDRVATYPNRYKVTPTNGDPEYYVVLERADDPTIAGTPLNSDTFNGILNEIESVLPDVTESDDGKVLVASGGAWIAGTLVAPEDITDDRTLKEAGYYHIMFVPAYTTKQMDFGVMYWDGTREVSSQMVPYEMLGGHNPPYIDNPQFCRCKIATDGTISVFYVQHHTWSNQTATMANSYTESEISNFGMFSNHLYVAKLGYSGTTT